VGGPFVAVFVDLHGIGKVVGGTPAPVGLDLSAGEQDAVVAIWYAGKVVCTGALVTPWAVLTASHAPLQPGLEVRVGPDAASPREAGRVVVVERMPGRNGPVADVALVRLDRALGATPLRVSALPPSGSVVVAGYGRTQPDVTSNTSRWWVSEPVVSRGAGWFRVAGDGTHGLCKGDSGAPALVAGAAGTGPGVVGAVSQGSVPCVGEDVFAIPDPVWAAAVLGRWGGPGAPLRSWTWVLAVVGLVVVGSVIYRGRSG